MARTRITSSAATVGGSSATYITDGTNDNDTIATALPERDAIFICHE